MHMRRMDMLMFIIMAFAKSFTAILPSKLNKIKDHCKYMRLRRVCQAPYRKSTNKESRDRIGGTVSNGLPYSLSCLEAPSKFEMKPLISSIFFPERGHT